MISIDYIFDMDSYDLFDLIKKTSIDNEEMAVSINNIIMLSDGSKLSKELNEHWIEYCDDTNICPCCGEELKVITNEYKDDEEKEYIRRCSNCG